MPNLLCWDALDPYSSDLDRAQALFEMTQPIEERIPWEWIVRSVRGRATWRPGQWGPHLLLAASRLNKKKLGEVVGFASGMHLPGFGGYLSYIGVDPEARRQGVGSRLIRLLQHVLAADACGGDENLPCIIWESRPPAVGDEAGHVVWRSRLRLFERVGAQWISGINFHAISYTSSEDTPIPLQLFVLPVAQPVETFTGDALVRLVAGLGRHVYRMKRAHPFMHATLPAGVQPVLRPVPEVLGLRRD